MKLQIPFSEPIADGPVILRANQKALEQGIQMQACLDFAAQVAKNFEIPFLSMSYHNILHQYGVNRFVKYMALNNLSGAIAPDQPPEEGRVFAGYGTA